MIKQEQLGRLELEGFVQRRDANLNNIKLAVIGLGQAGGKMAQEFARAGIYTVALNTAQADLDHLSIIPPKNRILLGSIGGASKDIRIGRQVILENKDIVQSVLERDEIINADFVFVIAGLGGGTGNGGLPTILNALSILREDKKFKNKPTIGAIVSVPGDWEKRQLKRNAVAGIGAIQKLVQSEKIGSVLIVDNQKLANDYMKKAAESRISLSWENYGNIALASTIIETIAATSLPQVNAFDRAEWLDVFSTPGFLMIGKQTHTSDLKDTELKQFVEDGFRNSNIFADDYNFDYDAKIGGAIVIRPANKFLNNVQRTQIEEIMNDLLKGAEVTHFGLIDNHLWGKLDGKNIPDDNEKLGKVILYTLAVVESLPKRVFELVNSIKAEEKELEEVKVKKKDDPFNFDEFIDLYKPESSPAHQSNKADLFDDEEIFGPQPTSTSQQPKRDIFKDDDLLP